MSGEVKKFAKITPNSAVLRGAAGEKISKIITIVPNFDKPFKIVNVNALKGTDFIYSLKEAENFGEKIYTLIVENTKKTKGKYTDKIVVTTDNSDFPPLSIMVYGDIR